MFNDFRFWKEIKMFSEEKILNKFCLRYSKVKHIGTEGHCLKVVSRTNGKTYALKVSKPFEKHNGPPYQLLRQLNVLTKLRKLPEIEKIHSNICILRYVSYESCKLLLFFDFVDLTLSDIFNQKEKLNDTSSQAVLIESMSYYSFISF